MRMKLIKLQKSLQKSILAKTMTMFLQRTPTKIISIRTLYLILSAELMATNTDMKMVTGKDIYSRLRMKYAWSMALSR